MDGVDFVVGEGMKFKVKRFGGKNSAKIRKLTALYHKPYARMIELGTLPEEKEREIYIKIFVEACLISWEGIQDENGEDIEFTRDNAIELFMELPEMFDLLSAYASDVNSYKEELGNS